MTRNKLNNNKVFHCIYLCIIFNLVVSVSVVFYLFCKLSGKENPEQNSCYPVAKVTVTCYNSTIEQTNEDPFTTSFNVTPKPGTLAVSRDLLDRGFIPFSKVWLEGFGEFVVADIMNKRFTKRVDIWMPEGTPIFKEENVRMIGYCAGGK